MVFRGGCLVVLGFGLMACSHQTPQSTHPSTVKPPLEQTRVRPKRPFRLEQPTPLEQLLKEQYQSWRGVPYRLGGMSKSGIDCSGFVVVTFQNRIGIALPRSTEALVQVGEPVDRRKLKTGDLVFFKTGWKELHVGIYLNDGFFIHASTSKGVTISSLDNPYWNKVYWMSRRVIR
jgi:cell wall-associated NlpC family hydrolase